MPNVLVVAELGEGGALKNASLSAITFAKKALPAIGGGFDLLLLGATTAEAAKELAGHGAGKILVAEDPSFANYTAERFAPTVSEVAKNYGLVVATATTFGKDLLPRVAARCDAA